MQPIHTAAVGGHKELLETLINKFEVHPREKATSVSLSALGTSVCLKYCSHYVLL